MFELTAEEHSSSRSQNGTLKQGENVKYVPMMFAELCKALHNHLPYIRRTWSSNDYDSFCRNATVIN